MCDHACTAPQKRPISIFNDVVGPVMRGSSSSHVAASVRIGNMVRQLIEGEPNHVIVEMAKTGAIAPAYHEQGTDQGLAAGLMGWATDEKYIENSLDEAIRRKIKMSFLVKDVVFSHPNTLSITVKNSRDQVSIKAISLGGGAIEITEIDGFPVVIHGDFYETLIFLEKVDAQYVQEEIKKIKKFFDNYEYLYSVLKGDKALVGLKTRSEIPQDIFGDLPFSPYLTRIRRTYPALAVLSGESSCVPFSKATETLRWCSAKDTDLYEAALHYEQEIGGLTRADVFAKAKTIVKIMENSIKEGLQGTEYSDRLLPSQVHLISRAQSEGRFIPMGVLDRAIIWTMAVMEVKSAMGVIVAAPTAGACGILPGTILGTAHHLDLEEDDVVKAILAAGIVGVFVATNASFAGEECGCQAECGAASAMAAAGIVQLVGGNANQGLGAASIALQNMLGSICDPVARRVEVPCLGRNIMGTANAISAANLALAGIDPVVPLDETIEAMFQVGKILPQDLKCTGFGGLSLTPTSLRLEKWLARSNRV